VTIAKTGLNNLELKERARELQEEITERKNAEKARRESETKYSTFLENSKDGIIMFVDGILTFVNKASINFVGYTPEEMVDTDIFSFVAPDYRKFVAEK
jgi:PAS domain-containing protein